MSHHPLNQSIPLTNHEPHTLNQSNLLVNQVPPYSQPIKSNISTLYTTVVSASTPALIETYYLLMTGVSVCGNTQQIGINDDTENHMMSAS